MIALHGYLVLSALHDIGFFTKTRKKLNESSSIEKGDGEVKKLHRSSRFEQYSIVLGFHGIGQ